MPTNNPPTTFPRAAYAGMFGPTTGDRVRLADTSLFIEVEKDFTTYRFLGNMGTAALPVTAAIAAERGWLAAGQRVGFLGIGSGLTCLMMGLEW